MKRITIGSPSDFQPNAALKPRPPRHGGEASPIIDRPADRLQEMQLGAMHSRFGRLKALFTKSAGG